MVKRPSLFELRTKYEMGSIFAPTPISIGSLTFAGSALVFHKIDGQPFTVTYTIDAGDYCSEWLVTYYSKMISTSL